MATSVLVAVAVPVVDGGLGDEGLDGRGGGCRFCAAAAAAEGGAPRSDAVVEARKENMLLIVLVFVLLLLWLLLLLLLLLLLMVPLAMLSVESGRCWVDERSAAPSDLRLRLVTEGKRCDRFSESGVGMGGNGFEEIISLAAVFLVVFRWGGFVLALVLVLVLVLVLAIL